MATTRVFWPGKFLPWPEEPGELPAMGSQRVRADLLQRLSRHHHRGSCHLFSLFRGVPNKSCELSAMLFWALSKLMAGSYRNRSTEDLRRTIQLRIKTVIQKQRGGWRKPVCPKPTITMRTVSDVWISQDIDTLGFSLLIYSLHLMLLFLLSLWHHLS